MNKIRLIEFLSMQFDELLNNKELQGELTEYYKFIYNLKTCTSCKNKFQSYYKKLLVDGVEKMTIKTSLFQLRNDIGVNQITLDNGDVILQNDAADDICIQFLKENPNRISLFIKYPENWMELTQNNDSENENE